MELVNSSISVLNRLCIVNSQSPGEPHGGSVPVGWARKRVEVPKFYISEFYLELATFKDRLVFLVGDAPPYAWAAKVGIPKGTFTNMWKHGGVPRDETLRKIVTASGCRYEWLASGAGEALMDGLERPINPLESGDEARDRDVGLDQLRNRARDEGLSDGDLMESIIEGVERFAERNGLPLTPERKATFIMLFYRYFKEEGQVDQDKLGEMLRKVG